jgi:flagellar protein FliS
MDNNLKVYQRVQISGLNQKELIVMLYSGALKFINEGKNLILEKDINRTHEKLSKARDVFVHLLTTLNVEAGGELAEKLSSLYAYFIEKITMANVTKEIGELDDIIPLIQEIKESWEKIDINDKTIPESKKIAKPFPVNMFSAEV